MIFFMMFGVIAESSNSIIASTQWARCLMKTSASMVGVDWEADSNLYREELSHMKIPRHIPSYFRQPLHGFKYGGLCIEQALYQTVSMRHVMRMFQFDPYFREKSIHSICKKIDINDDVVLDLGCGSGDSTSCLKNTFPNAHIIGIDMSPYMVKLANLRVGGSFLVCDAATLPFIDDSIGMVSSFAMFHEMPRFHAIRILKDSYRVLKPNGYFCAWDQKISAFSTLQISDNTPIEPFLESYSKLNMVKNMKSIGFRNVKEYEDKSFSIWIGQK